MGTAAYIAIAIPTVIIAIWMSIILNMTSKKPLVVVVLMKIQKYEFMMVVMNKNIKVGTKLYNNSYVTSKLKILNTNKVMYRVNDIIVSGSHFIKDYTNTWVKVKQYERAIEINDYNKEYIYCINTSNKVINIGNDLFLDWDDITQLDVVKLKNNLHINMDDDESNIHLKMEGGL